MTTICDRANVAFSAWIEWRSCQSFFECLRVSLEVVSMRSDNNRCESRVKKPGGLWKQRESEWQSDNCTRTFHCVQLKTPSQKHFPNFSTLASSQSHVGRVTNPATVNLQHSTRQRTTIQAAPLARFISICSVTRRRLHRCPLNVTRQGL